MEDGGGEVGAGGEGGGGGGRGGIMFVKVRLRAMFRGHLSRGRLR